MFSRAFMGYTIARHRLRNAAAQAASSGATASSSSSGGASSRNSSSSSSSSSSSKSNHNDHSSTGSKNRVLSSTPLFTCSLGVSFAPKRRRKQPSATGEDAFFYNVVRGESAADAASAAAPTAGDSARSDGDGNGNGSGSGNGSETVLWLGVLDGVGGWADQGVDPSIFARRLAHHLDVVSASRSTSGGTDTDPRAVLTDAYAKLLEDDEVQMGSSTACVASVAFSDSADSAASASVGAVVRVANLGDSGYMLISGSGEILTESKPQTYFFNAPYQLAKMPPAMRKKGSLQNQPTDADLSEHAVSPPSSSSSSSSASSAHVAAASAKAEGDSTQYLILATDGYFDNVHASTTAAVVAHVHARGGAATEVMLAAEAEAHARQLRQEADIQLSELRKRLSTGPASATAGRKDVDQILAAAKAELQIEDGRSAWSTAVNAVNSIAPTSVCPPPQAGAGSGAAVGGVDEQASDIARLLTALAVRAGRDPHAATPFAEEARRHRLRYRGGKEDDVVVMVVKLAPRTTDTANTASAAAAGAPAKGEEGERQGVMAKGRAKL